MPRAAIFMLFVVPVLAAGCHGGGGDPNQSCSAVAAKFFELAKYDLGHATVDGAMSRKVTDQLPAMRDALAQACLEGKWSETTRGCLVRANDHVGFETCEQQLTDEQRRDLDRGFSSRPEDRRNNPETPK